MTGAAAAAAVKYWRAISTDTLACVRRLSAVISRPVLQDLTHFFKIGHRKSYLQPYGRTCVVSVALWSAPLPERPKGPLKFVVQPKTAQKESFNIRATHRASILTAAASPTCHRTPWPWLQQ